MSQWILLGWLIWNWVFVVKKKDKDKKNSAYEQMPVIDLISTSSFSWDRFQYWWKYSIFSFSFFFHLSSFLFLLESYSMNMLYLSFVLLFSELVIWKKYSLSIFETGTVLGSRDKILNTTKCGSNSNVTFNLLRYRHQ